MRLGSATSDDRVLLIAELGNNHEGDAGRARELVDAAADAGADAVKLQTFRTERFVDPADHARVAQLERFRLRDHVVVELAERARARGLSFLSTPLDLESARFLEPLVDAYKIASGDLAFYPLLDVVCATGRPLVLSTGISTLEKVSGSVEYVRSRWAEHGHSTPLAVLHCVTSYPAPPEQAGLAAIATLARELGPETVVGYSDHTLGIDVCALAVAAGASVLEKHFTLDKQQSSFRDHALSADPPELAQLVKRVREVERVLGDGRKLVQEAEAPLAAAVSRSIAAASGLSRGDALRAEDLMWTRPGGGLAPGEEHVLLGRELRRDVAVGERLSAADVV